jgi:K+-transporting ATPase KdpF subunit
LGGECVRRVMLELVLGAIVAAVIGFYLLYALLHPEKL